MYSLDNIDRQLIGLLRSNAREPVARLATTIGVSRATVQNRIDKLEKKGVITGYTTLISTAADQGLSLVRAHTSIELEGQSLKKVRAKLLQEPCVTAIHSTNGHWDMVIELQAGSLAEFDEVLGRIRDISGIVSSETSILLSTVRTTAK